MLRKILFITTTTLCCLISFEAKAEFGMTSISPFVTSAFATSGSSPFQTNFQPIQTMGNISSQYSFGGTQQSFGCGTSPCGNSFGGSFYSGGYSTCGFSPCQPIRPVCAMTTTTCTTSFSVGCGNPCGGFQTGYNFGGFTGFGGYGNGFGGYFPQPQPYFGGYGFGGYIPMKTKDISINFGHGLLGGLLGGFGLNIFKSRPVAFPSNNCGGCMFGGKSRCGKSRCRGKFVAKGSWKQSSRW